MPFARLTLIPAPLPGTIRQLAVGLTEVIARDLKKRHDLTAVAIQSVEGCWTIGAHSPEVAAHVEVSVTAGTNSKEEKRAFIQNTMLLLRQALPELGTATYVVVRELPASDWGYDGQTQLDRIKIAPPELLA